MNFPEHFREHVMPRLRNLATAQAVCIAYGVETWEGAHVACMRYANRYGSQYLPPAIFDALDSWVSSTILAALMEAEAKPDPEIARIFRGLAYCGV